MTVVRAVTLSVLVVVAGTVSLLLWGLVAGRDVNVPLFVEVDWTTTASGEPVTTMGLSLVGPLVAVVVLAAVFWLSWRLVLRSVRPAGR